MSTWNPPTPPMEEMGKWRGVIVALGEPYYCTLSETYKVGQALCGKLGGEYSHVLKIGGVYLIGCVSVERQLMPESFYMEGFVEVLTRIGVLQKGFNWNLGDGEDEGEDMNERLLFAITILVSFNLLHLHSQHETEYQDHSHFFQKFIVRKLKITNEVYMEWLNTIN
eukprot:TRINITY_DN11797_c0_g1_i1.p2 TRINITY_DN11797_c0_g1~~TRINITY_DN11797_c0_g1_i1.p2  ORF type:complete len:167 (-),score=38.89 TRINITY_DN11797_c0_g1_i1:45-545(-)